jgi:hypothetical protein
MLSKLSPIRERQGDHRMIEYIVRDCVVADRLARGLADYYSRKVRGVRCPDPLPPEQRASIDNLHDQRLRCARLFVESARAFT